VHDEILRRYPAARLKVLAVWFDMLRGDSRRFLDTRVLGDPRVTYYWDEGRVAGRWFSDHVTGSSDITWDQYFLFGPDARWDRTPRPLISSGGSVIGSAEELRSAISPFLTG